MKLYNLISESNDSNVTYTELTPVDRKLLQFMWKKGISQNNDKLIHKFLKDTLAIDDLETQVRLINLYMLNAPNADHQKGFLDMDKVVELDTNSSNDYIKVLSEFKGIPETFVVEVYSGSLGGDYDTYLPEYRIFDVARGQYESYVIARDSGEAWDAAETHVYNMIDGEGYDGFSQEWLVEHVSIDEEEIELYIRETTEERAREDLSEDELRDELFEYNNNEWEEFDGAEYDIKSDKEEIKKLSLEIQEKEFKKDNVESELIVLEKDIERLDYYSDDETNYRDMEYSEEIDELQHTYNNYKRIFEELETYLEESYKELDKLQINLEESKTIFEKYSGKSLMVLYVNTITEQKVEESLTDIEWFLNYASLDLDEAHQYGYIDIDKDRVVKAAVNEDGVGHWLAGYDGYENEEVFTVEDGNYSDTFYLYRTN